MKAPSPHSILIVGSINQDLILETPRMPLKGENLIGTAYSWMPGGKGANQAVALARLGAKSILMGRVGRDAVGVKLVQALEREGVDIKLISEDQSYPTGLAVIFLEPPAVNSILVFPGANMRIKPSDLTNIFATFRCDAIMLQLEIPHEVIIESCQIARQRGIPVILDAGPAQEFPLECLEGVDILSPNETETLALTGISVQSAAAAEQAASILMARSRAKAVVIKRGAAGSFLMTSDGCRAHLAPPRVIAVDPTAAGDAFNAAMTIRYLDTGSFRDAVAYANYAGAFAATKIGAQSALPTASELELFRMQFAQGLSANV